MFSAEQCHVLNSQLVIIVVFGLVATCSIHHDKLWGDLRLLFISGERLCEFIRISRSTAKKSTSFPARKLELAETRQN